MFEASIHFGGMVIKVVTPRARNVKKRTDEQQYTLKIWDPLRNDSIKTCYSKKGQMFYKSYKGIENNEYYDVSPQHYKVKMKL